VNSLRARERACEEERECACKGVVAHESRSESERQRARAKVKREIYKSIEYVSLEAKRLADKTPKDVLVLHCRRRASQIIFNYSEDRLAECCIKHNIL
jgi:hypothetical protein